MKLVSFFAALIGLGAFSLALPTTENLEARQACNSSVALDAKKNVWLNYTLHPQSVYRKQFVTATEAISDRELKDKALKLVNVGTFVWIETPEEIGKLIEAVKDVPCKNILGVVLAGLPYNDCLSSRAPPITTLWDYQSQFIDPIVKIIKTHPNTAFALIIEPSVIANYLLNPDDEVCQRVKPIWYNNIPLALKSLNLPNVIQYLDAGHGGIFGHQDGPNYNDLKKVSKELIDTWEAASRPEQFRGVAVNFRGYNSWDLSPGEIFPDEYPCLWTKNKARNEKTYLYLLESSIRKDYNSTMPFHNIMDTTRSGVQGVRDSWDDSCNVNGMAWGIKPTSNTLDERLDAFVWATEGGVSDGGSEVGATGYRSVCANRVAFKPMPERGMFSQAYFESLFKCSNPSL
ncbi:glycoside hydrolase family 6 protein [Lojkania enalia]|uniref:Glucanase n=1 Tax=Lojkania enalia TaxID=147567 RepID=A0A9P4N6L7_9PLEO|nr:glycoside hydrolase family 6 protein [Didymosphaeria enalia]